MVAALAVATWLLVPAISGSARAADPSPAPAVSPSGTSSGTSFHIDCNAGSDAADGRHPWTAWHSLDRANRAKLQPGDSLLLLRGCRWHGPLLVSWSGTADAPITVGAYGEGMRPIVEDSFQDILVTGSWFVISDIHVRADPPTHDLGCDRQPAGVRYGIFVDAGSRHGVLRRILANGLNTGVRIARGASYHQIIDSDFRDNNMKSDDPNSDSGAIGIDLQGDNNVVARNRISGSDACSRFFGGRDGSGVSVYGGRHNVIDHNLSSQNHDFIEVGDSRSTDTLIAYNVDHSTLPGAAFAVVHGLGSRYGPVRDTRIVHNTTVLTGKGSGAILCSQRLTGDDLQIAGNIVWSDGAPSTCKDGNLESDNLYWSSSGHPSIVFDLAPTSRVADPRLVDPEHGDLHLLSDSPAIDAIRPMDLGGVGDVDADGVPVPQGLAPDIGAYEYTTGPRPTPTPDPLPSASASPTASATAVPTELPTPTPVPTPTPEPRPSPGGLDPPPTGGPGALDQLLFLGAALGMGGLLVAVVLARRSPR